MLTPEQLAIRAKGIGGSEIGAIVGEHPYMRPIDVWRGKMGEKDEPDSFHLERGQFFERPTAEWYAHRHDAQLRTVGTLVHPSRPIVIATPDFLAKSSTVEIDLSIKVPGARTRHHWGAIGTDEAPPYAVVQVQWELLILEQLHGIRSAVIVAPLDGDLAEFPVLADAELQAGLVEAAERFWRDHVVTKRPPAPDASPAYTEWIKKRWPKSEGQTLFATDEAEGWAQRLRAARAARKRAEEDEGKAEQWLKAHIGDSDGIVGSDWSISYKSTKGRPSTDWKSLTAGLGIGSETIDRFTHRVPYRVFRPKFSGENSDD